jgi:RNA polymerase sigma factor for flagellar operon FliA
MSSPKQVDRDALILEYYPMVRRVAYRMARRLPQCVDADDLVNIGIIGLIDAVDRYQPERAPSFGAYARMRVQGAIVDEMRKNDWVPRSVRDRARMINQAKRSLSDKLGRDPTAAEVAKALGVDKERLAELIRHANIRVLVSTEEGGEDEGTVGERLASGDESPDELAARQHLAAIVRSVINELPEREQLIAEMYYFRDRTFKEIAQALNVTESRVSQLHSRMKKRIHEMLQDRLDELS